MNALSGLFSFEGRARRSEWWLTCIATGLLGGLVVTIVSLTLSGGDFEMLTDNAPKPAPILLANLIVGAAVLWAQTAVGVRRSHDRGQSGSGFILYQAIGYGSSYLPMIAQAVGIDAGLIPLGGAFLLALTALYVICAVYFLVTLGFLDGQPTANIYGQSPKTLQSSNYAPPRLDG